MPPDITTLTINNTLYPAAYQQFQFLYRAFCVHPLSGGKKLSFKEILKQYSTEECAAFQKWLEILYESAYPDGTADLKWDLKGVRALLKFVHQELGKSSKASEPTFQEPTPDAAPDGGRAHDSEEEQSTEVTENVQEPIELSSDDEEHDQAKGYGQRPAVKPEPQSDPE